MIQRRQRYHYTITPAAVSRSHVLISDFPFGSFWLLSSTPADPALRQVIRLLCVFTFKEKKVKYKKVLAIVCSRCESIYRIHKEVKYVKAFFHKVCSHSDSLEYMMM